ncbi:mitochondrial carrier [Lentinus tigrinus ALCF2SS1-7]|uniref:Mitochondrial carrier n=1 Tax=Lentinus tigrinus ALCF2SS1-6 TaxID=1328759 RepID=A0A5C2S9Z4_9APHY|nr:mitochondrial carrier [Lentinus tigrinus ALCF2SS1-6]RPD68066.1 mitochondrial carrier [Lentinus tigrinus ALCF2SS1-7]
MSSDGPRKDRQSLQYVIRSGLAGGIAGCVAKTVVAPLDRVKILFQASNPDFQRYAGTWSGAFRAVASIYHDNGVRGLLQGHSATLLRIFPYAAINFMTYDQAEAILMPTPDKQTNLRRFTAGAISGVTSVLFTYPLELVRVRMAYATRSAAGAVAGVGAGPAHRPSFLSIMRLIYSEGAPSASPGASASAPGTSPSPSPSTLFARFPLLKFYRGFTVSVAGMIPYAGTSFLAWGFLRATFLPAPPPSSSPGENHPKHKQKATPLADLSIGAVAGALAQTVSYPFEVVRRRMQVGGVTRPDRWLRWGETVRTIWAASGWRGFYVGLSIGYLKVVPMKAVSFAVWQFSRRMLGL